MSNMILFQSNSWTSIIKYPLQIRGRMQYENVLTYTWFAHSLLCGKIQLTPFKLEFLVSVSKLCHRPWATLIFCCLRSPTGIKLLECVCKNSWMLSLNFAFAELNCFDLKSVGWCEHGHYLCHLKLKTSQQ